MTRSIVQSIDTGLPRGVQGSADPHFACAVGAFSQLFPGRRFGGGALAVYLDGEPVVDVWTGWSDRRGEVLWSADTGTMVFSATKGLASTVIHRLADRGLINYDLPVAEYWPEFGVRGKHRITVRDVMRHRSGLAHLNGVTCEELLDHTVMERRLASARASRFVSVSAYHALTYGWLMSGLARAVTGMGMRDLIRTELAQPLDTDGLHLGRPPADAPTHPAQILFPQHTRQNRVFNLVAPRVAKLPCSGGFGALYAPGIRSFVQGDIPFLNCESPSANGVVTARALAKMYGAIANGGVIDGRQFLSGELVQSLTGKPNLMPDLNVVMPMAWHMGFHSVPLGGVLPGFGHAGLGGSLGWADPSSGMAFAFVHNRLLTPMILDQFAFVGLGALLRRGAHAARKHGPQVVPQHGSSYPESPGVVAG